jgi:hypothetical protein
MLASFVQNGIKPQHIRESNHLVFRGAGGSPGRFGLARCRTRHPINAIGKTMVHCQTLGHTRRRSGGMRWRKKYVSLNLVYLYWANLGGYR